MIVQHCNFVWILFIGCSLFVNEVAKGDTSSSSYSSFINGVAITEYAGVINGGEIGINITYNSTISPRMKVELYYDTETQSATNFFVNQFKPDVFLGFTNCDFIDWYFYPCGTSGLNSDGTLSCPMGQTQCDLDAIHACVAKLYKGNQVLIGKFIICFFNNNSDPNKCVGSFQDIVQTDVDQCVSSKAGIADCGAFFVQIHGPGSQPVLSPPTSGSDSLDFTLDFTKFLCQHVKNARLTCNYCPSPPNTPPDTPTNTPPSG